jgi:hypothetical protein
VKKEVEEEVIPSSKPVAHYHIKNGVCWSLTTQNQYTWKLGASNKAVKYGAELVPDALNKNGTITKIEYDGKYLPNEGEYDGKALLSYASPSLGAARVWLNVYSISLIL